MKKSIGSTLLAAVCWIGLGGGAMAQTEGDRSIMDDLRRKLEEAQEKVKAGLRDAAPPTASYAPVVEKASPSVVTISSSKTVRRNASPLFNDPMFRRFFGDPGGPGGGGGAQRSEALGSGVIVSEDGYVITNNHVIDGADEIVVSFGQNGGKEYKAKRIGADALTDIAVLKIEAKGLPSVEFADSDRLRVGDVVLALGSPLGLTQSVSMGIVSALNRGGLGIAGYENFIQTDAAINQGNSGGALVDARGRLVGINTAIFSMSGGNQGIGFAVPSNIARDVMQKLLGKGRVARGYIGIRLQPLTQDLAESFGLKEARGALVGDVMPGTPAAKAGLEAGDVVTALDGKQVVDWRELQVKIGAMEPETSITLAVLRGGKERQVTVKLGELQNREDLAAAGSAKGGDAPNVLDGITVDDLTPEARRQFQVPAGVEGALVTAIEAESRASRAELRPGDVIHEINRQPVKNADAAVELSRKIGEKDKVLLRVSRGGASRFVVLGAG